MMRKLPQYISQLFSCMLLFLLDVTVGRAAHLHMPCWSSDVQLTLATRLLSKHGSHCNAATAVTAVRRQHVIQLLLVRQDTCCHPNAEAAAAAAVTNKYVFQLLLLGH